MTTAEKITAFKNEMQQFEIGKDAALFNRTVPEKISEIKSFIKGILEICPSFKKSTEHCLVWMDEEIADLKKISRERGADLGKQQQYLRIAKKYTIFGLEQLENEIAWRSK